MAGLKRIAVLGDSFPNHVRSKVFSSAGEYDAFKADFGLSDAVVLWRCRGAGKSVL